MVWPVHWVRLIFWLAFRLSWCGNCTAALNSDTPCTSNKKQSVKGISPIKNKRLVQNVNVLHRPLIFYRISLSSMNNSHVSLCRLRVLYNNLCTLFSAAYQWINQASAKRSKNQSHNQNLYNTHFFPLRSGLYILLMLIPDSTKKASHHKYNWHYRPNIHLHLDFLLTLPQRLSWFLKASCGYAITGARSFTSYHRFFNIFLAFSWYSLILFLTSF